MTKRLSTTFILLLCLILAAPAARAQRGHDQAEVSKDVQHDVSPPVRGIQPHPRKARPPKAKDLQSLPPKAGTTGQTDPVVQTTAGPLVGTTNGLNFLGIGADFVGPQGAFSVDTAPPDPNGAVGPTQYVQWINTSFAVFDKATGAALYGPVPGDTLWTGFGGPCENNNDGDPIVKYDRQGGRWVLSQLAVSGGPPYYQCIAVSDSSDATGAYNRYAFQFSNLNDYPKLAVWPDAYYATYNLFQGSTFLGAKVCAMDRNQMMAGLPATQQCFQLATNFGAVLPSDLDGATPPPAGSPDFILGYQANTLNLWKFHADFATPANSTLTGPASIPVAAFNEACNGGGTCIPQSGTNQKLDSVGDRPMYRLAYRNFADHEALVVNHSVAAGGRVGIRWYEVRNPIGTPTLYQQGTYAPDSSYRWMGSIAMDKVGNVALGYSVSSGAMHPAVRYTGRAPTDPLGSMQAESSIIEGTGSQLPVFGSSLSRWGDYSALAVDPTDDCTFWYTNEYLKTNGSFNWSTRIASFSFPSCTSAPATPDFVVSSTPASRVVAVGTSGTYSVTVTPSGGFSGTVTFSVSGLPSGAAASFSPASVTGSGSTTMTVTTAAATPLGSYPLTITAASGAISHSVTDTLVVYVPAVAIFVRTDKTAQGTWKGVYGANGYAIANDSTNYPAYAQVALGGQSNYTWAASTTDVRALQKGAATDRIASTWYSSSNFTIDLNLVDGNSHQVAFYCLDWTSDGRTQRIEVVDAMTNTVLDSRNVSSFISGQYLLWNLAGHVIIRVTNTGPINAVVSGLFFDVAGPVTPDFALSATPSSQATTGGSANYTVGVASSGGFGGTITFSATGWPAGAVASFNPATVTVSGSTTMTVTTAPNTPGGSYTITITGMSGALSRSVTVTLVVPATAVFLKSDAATQGTWKGVYGANGFAIANDVTSYPAYAQVTFANQSSYTWAASTTDVRALQKGAATDRIASTWYAASFTIDVNLTDDNPHQVAIYSVDWDLNGRAQTIDILDATSNAVLDTRNMANFGSGQYVAWNLSGHVIIRVTRTGGINGVVSGLFFDAPGVVTPDFAISATPGSQTVAAGASAAYTVSVTSSGGFSGAVSFSASGLPAGTSAGFNPASVTTSGSSTMTLTTGVGTPGGSFPITITAVSGGLNHAATVTLVVTVTVPAAAIFVKTDAATQGTWKGVYGANGYAIANDVTSYPAYARVALSGQSNYTWVASTTDVRALQKGAATDRIAATWYSSSNFIFDVNLVDGSSHEVAFYCLDWAADGRSQTIDILDASSNAVLDSRSVSNFTNGLYVIWNLTGHVKIRVTNTGPVSAVVSGLFFDSPAVVTPDFSLSASPSTRMLSGGSASYTVTISSAGGFNGVVNFSASGLPAGASAGFNPATVTGSGSSTMTVTAPSAPPGTYSVTITGVSGGLSRSATVTLAVPATAIFVKMDPATQGTWKGVYGAGGYAIANDATNYPAYATVTMSGQSSYTWASSTTDVRALQKGAATDRIASTWYASASFTIDVNLTDGNPHQVGVYCVDWDLNGRAQTIDILDATSNAVLDSRSLSNFSGGQYLAWNLSGHVKIRVTRTGGINGVVSGLFFDVAGPVTPDFSLSVTPGSSAVPAGSSAGFTLSVVSSGGFSGTVSFSASGLPAGAAASFSPASVTTSGSSTMTVTTTAATPGGSYPITITATSGGLTHTATVTLAILVSVPAAATFVSTDLTTQGTWKGVYGAVGYSIANDSTNYPAWAPVTLSGQNNYTWAAATTDVRALQKGNASDRIASTWYSGTVFTIDVNLGDGNPHQVALYCLDWTLDGRTQTIDILDAASSTVLDSRSVSSFTAGKYLVWNLSGHVKIRITNTGPINAVVSALFVNN